MLIPYSVPAILAAIFCVLPLLSLYAFWRIRRAEGAQWLRWNQVQPLPFTTLEMVVLLALIGLGMKSQTLSIFLPIVAFGGAVWLTRKHGINLALQWGLDFSRFPSLFRASFNTYFALLLPVAIASALSIWVCQKFGYSDLLQPAVELMRTGDRNQVITIFILATIFAPIWEEMIFRGIVYPWLKSRTSQKAALIVSALFFAAIHHHLPSFLPLSFLGLALAFAYERSGSILSSMVLHALFNFATCLNLLLMRQA